MSIIVHLCSLLTFIKTHLLQLNLFESGIEDGSIIRNERRSTRLYLFIFIISLFIIGLYYSVIPYAHTTIIPSPSSIEYSTLSKEVSLQCPCTKIAVKYNEFVKMKPVYHELCQSHFISDEYIHQLYILYEQTWNKSISTDYHRIAVFQFQTLRTLCQLTQKTIKDNLQTFLQTEFIQTQMISHEELQSQIASFIADFIDSTPKTFLRTLKFIQNITAQSLFMTGASLTSVLPRKQYRHIYSESVPYIGMIYTFEDGSSCTCSSSTANNCMGLATLKNDIVPGFQTGCYMFSALLNSTLEVFYNETFVNILTGSSNYNKKLNSSFSNSTIETLLSRMFVTHWSNETSFERYFNHCAPNLCQYTVTKQHGFLPIIIILIGFFGGLSSILRIITPFIITTLWPIIWKLINIRQTPVLQIVETEINTVLSVGDRLKRFFRLIKQNLIELNLFPSVPPSQNENILREEHYTTRIYLILFILSLIIVTVLTSINPQTIRVTVKSPSSKDFIQLHEQYPRTLHCPCSETTIDYQSICRIEPQYHEVCSSEFVSSNWINIQFRQSSKTILVTNDIRYQSEFHFQLLSTVCHMANQIIEDSRQSFYQTKFVTNKALNPQSFQTQVDSIVAEFKKMLPTSFLRVIQLIKANSKINQFITPMNSDFTGSYSAVKGYIYLYPFRYSRTEEQHSLTNDEISEETSDCSSFSPFECYQKTMIKENGTNNKITGMVQTWFPFQSLMMSTLECFYSDTCLSQIEHFINTTQSPTNFTTLNSSSLLDNNQYDRIETLANRLFIQSWDNESFYESYFNQCHPLTCIYTYESRLNLIYIVTTIIGFMGGLNVVLRLLLPLIVKLVARVWNYILQRQGNNSITGPVAASMRTRFCDSLRTLLMYSKKTMVEFNLFPTIPRSTDPTIMRRNRRTTRIYLILLITALFILIIYTTLRQETVTITVKSPSLSRYRELSIRYPLTLQCPCNRIAIKFKEFISQIEPQYHQICSSIFVSQKWFNSVSDLNLISYDEKKNDFRKAIRTQFQTLSTFCKLSQNTLNTSLPIFKETNFITAYVISRAEFDVRTEAVIEQFKRTTSNQFIETFKLIQATNHANQLATLYRSNWLFVPKDFYSAVNLNPDSIRHVLTRPQSYGIDGCSCGIQSNCSILVTFPFPVSDQLSVTTLLGFLHGCLTLDSFLQSTLACLYNETCLTLMQASVYYSKPIPADVLTYSSLSMPNTTIETLLSQLFVSQWFQNTSFDLYFNACAPQSCQYSYVLEYNSLYVVTTLIALFGGLTNGLHFLVKYLAIIVYKIVDRRKKKTQIAPDSKQLDIVTIDQDNGKIEVVQSLPPRTTTVQVKMAFVEEQRRPEEIRRDRIILVCLSLLAVVAIVTVYIILFTTRNKEQQLILTTLQTTVKSNNSILIELTSISTSICLMTLKYQSQIYPTGRSPVSMMTGDFNHDSIVDLAVINADSDTLSVMLGNGDGTFQTQRIYSTGNGSSPREIATGDINNDTFLDLGTE